MNWYIRISQQQAPSKEQLSVKPMSAKPSQPEGQFAYTVPEDEQMLKNDMSYVTNMVRNPKANQAFKELYQEMQQKIYIAKMMEPGLFFDSNLVVDETQLSPRLQSIVSQISSVEDTENPDNVWESVFDLGRKAFDFSVGNQYQLQNPSRSNYSNR